MTDEEKNIVEELIKQVNAQLKCFDTKLGKIKSSIENFYREKNTFEELHNTRCDNMEINLKAMTDKIGLLPCVVNTTDIGWMKKIILRFLWIFIGSVITISTGMIIYILKGVYDKLIGG